MTPDADKIEIDKQVNISLRGRQFFKKNTNQHNQ
jgi:hypothetical protein